MKRSCHRYLLYHSGTKGRRSGPLMRYWAVRRLESGLATNHGGPLCARHRSRRTLSSIDVDVTRSGAQHEYWAALPHHSLQKSLVLRSVNRHGARCNDAAGCADRFSKQRRA